VRVRVRVVRSNGKKGWEEVEEEIEEQEESDEESEDYE